MKKILLTGATGLIGKYAIKPLLDLGFEVFAVSGKDFNGQKSKFGENQIKWIKADLLNFEDIKNVFEKVKPEYLLHFAWDTTPGSYLESDLNFKWLDSSLEMLKQFKIQGGKRAVYAGTCFEYEFEYAKQGDALKEYGKLNPTSIYAKCKNQLNELATAYSKDNDISFGWGRIFYVFGEGEHENRLVPKVINNLINDKEVSIWVGELIKDYMFAGDIAEAFVAFLDTNVVGCVNISSGIPMKIKDMVGLIAKKLGKENLVKFEDKQTGEPKVILGDNTRLIGEVKYIPRHSLSDALDKVIKSVKVIEGQI